MNGRCHKDALDRAEDICELCGHQFCAACVLFPRGHRNPPTCKTCALENSGLRGTTKSKHPISKREYKKRKKELLRQLEGIEDEEPAIEYFDLDDPTHFQRTTELDRRPEQLDEPETIDILGRLEDPSTDEPAPAAVPADPASATPPPPVPPPPAPVPPTPVAPAPVAASSADAGGNAHSHDAVSGLAPVDTSVNPLALDTPSRPAPVPAEPAPSEASATAAELLARLKADQPIQSQFTSPAPRSLDTDPFATPPSDLPPPAPLSPSPTPPPAAGAVTPAAGSVTPDSDPFASATTPAEAPRPKKSEPWTPPAPPPRGSNLDAMSGSPPPGAAPPAVLPQPTPVAATAAEPTPMPIPHAPQTTAEPAVTSNGGADLDESGQWIPPSLRGMATPEERAADPLPKRR